MDEIILIEVDPDGRRRRSEDFAADRLGDAVARLYERYADLLPDGPARVRAAATARAVVAGPGPGPPPPRPFAPLAPGRQAGAPPPHRGGGLRWDRTAA